MKYSQYTPEDFVQDEYFQKWILDNDEMTANFWQNWLAKHPEKKTTVKEAKKLIRLMHMDHEKLAKVDFDSMWQHIIEKRTLKGKGLPKRQNRKKVLTYLKYTAAASVILAIATTFNFYEENSTKQELAAKPELNSIKIGTDKAILTLENNIDIVLEKGEEFSTESLKSNGKELIYAPLEKEKESTVFNYITIPRGGQFFVQLSDGTKVWLNSETKLKYPVQFAKGKDREVSLLYGEAYFEVSPSDQHQGAKFKLVSGVQEIEVLGTAFNVKAYADEPYIFSTLVEGKVLVHLGNITHELQPNEQIQVDKNSQDFAISSVDINIATAWKKGLFSFKEKSLKDIMTVLARWYDVEVLFEDKALENIKFKGVLSKNQGIEDILSLIQKTKFIEAYEIKNNLVVIKK